MLTSNNYQKGLASLEQLKYNINYNKKPLFDIVCANLASKLINQDYIVLTECQTETLNKLINK